MHRSIVKLLPEQSSNPDVHLPSKAVYGRVNLDVDNKPRTLAGDFNSVQRRALNSNPNLKQSTQPSNWLEHLLRLGMGACNADLMVKEVEFLATVQSNIMKNTVVALCTSP